MCWHAIGQFVKVSGCASSYSVVQTCTLIPAMAGQVIDILIVCMRIALRLVLHLNVILNMY